MKNKMQNLMFGILILAALALLIFSPPASADGFQFSVEPGTSAGAGSTGNAFDVLVTNTSSSSLLLSGFSFGITTADSEISFTGATTSTVAPYAFAGDSFVDINGFTLFTNSLPGQTLEGSDLSNSGVGASIAAGETVGVGTIVFDVAAGATPGSFGVLFEDFPITSLSDSRGNNLDFTAQGGTITITNTAMVPEPTEGELMIFALAFAGFVILIRRGRTALRANDELVGGECFRTTV